MPILGRRAGRPENDRSAPGGRSGGRRSHLRGLEGERAVSRALARRGWTVVRARHRARAGELDIVAARGERLLIVEVKARSGEGGYETAWEAVTPAKRRRLRLAAADYLAEKGIDDVDVRFAVARVRLDGAGHAVGVDLLEDAFDA